MSSPVEGEDHVPAILVRVVADPLQIAGDQDQGEAGSIASGGPS